MAAMIVIFAGAILWLEFLMLRHVHRASLREAQAATEAARTTRVEDLLARMASEIAVLLDLRACWFEPFPFDTLLPRIEEGRIVLPVEEPGMAPWSDAGVELPVRRNGLTIGRFVLQPGTPSVGVAFSPTARDRALAIADRLAEPVAAALVRGDGSRLRLRNARAESSQAPR
jgi:hypothetical protein